MLAPKADAGSRVRMRPGRSPRAPLTPPASCAARLDELPGKLSDRPAHLAGMSYGGRVAMSQAHPRARASRLHHAARPRRAQISRYASSSKTDWRPGR
jgi:pimeloyl-ACP methyl ester carboxylesterase